MDAFANHSLAKDKFSKEALAQDKFVMEAVSIFSYRCICKTNISTRQVH